MRALVVDDDDFTRVLLVRTLRGFGYSEVVDAGGAPEALALARQHRPDLAIVDLDLGPGPNGIDVAYGLRRILPTIAMAILSSYQDPRLVGSIRPMPIGAVYLAKRSVGDADTLHDTLAALVQVPLASREPPPRTLDAGRRLSDNQVEVMRLVAEGFSNSEIARRRHLTEAAVEKAIARLIKQLELSPGKEDNSRVLITQAYYTLIGSTQVRRD